jgi:hypothetical protein
MTTSIDNVFVQTYETNVRHLAQQGITRLRPWVMEKSVKSEAHNWERLGLAEATVKSGRMVETPNVDTPFSRRKSTPITYHVGDSTEQEDIVQMLVDPNSNIAAAQAKAMRRAFDDEIIKAAVGPSTGGDGAPIAFPSGQAIGTTGSPIVFSFDLVTEVSERFMANDIDPDEGKVFVIGPAQARKLLQLTEATSGDYNAVRPLTSKGYIESWMGYTWIVSTRLTGQAAGELDCFAMTKKAIGLQVNKDVWSRVAEDVTMSFAWRIYCAATFGAVRVEDEHIVRVTTTETV